MTLPVDAVQSPMESPRCVPCAPRRVAQYRLGAEVPLVDGYVGAMESYGSLLLTESRGCDPQEDNEIVSVPLVQGSGEVKVQVDPARRVLPKDKQKMQSQEGLVDCDGVQICLLQQCEECGLQDSKEALETHRNRCPGKKGRK